MSILDGIKLISWDCDGTLYSLRGLKLGLWRRALTPGSALRVRDLRAMLAYHREIEVQRGQPINTAALEAHADTAAAEQHWFAEIVRDLGPTPRAQQLCEAAKARGIVQVVLSDLAAESKIQALGLAHYFTAIYAASAFGAFKPAPESFALTERLHGVSAGEHLHIGDRDETDGAGARAAGARFLQLRG